MNRLDELDALHAAATPGEWSCDGHGGIQMDGTRDGYDIFHGPICVARTPIGAGNGRKQKRDDFAAIVALRNSWPEIARALRAAAALRTKCRMDCNSGFGIREGWVQVRQAHYDAMIDAMIECGKALAPLTKENG